jgi:HD-GYP domain-containing protein (c-di-GMP phosphodiesterase class II)
MSSVDGAEIIWMEIHPDSIMWMSLGEIDCVEFYYVIEGQITLGFDGEPDRTINAGGSFCVGGIDKEFSIKGNTKVQLLGVTNKPIFDDMQDHMGNLKELVEKTEAKNLYTYEHGKRVMEYSLKIAEEMGISKESYDSITMAAALHDVGKCFLPDHILNEDEELTTEDVRQIRKHPINSHRLIQGKFGDKIAEIAQSHHERLDGSGYPFGLYGEEISIEARIIAVADVFDAMTTDRIYKLAKTRECAMEELMNLTKEYDENVIRALNKLMLLNGI